MLQPSADLVPALLAIDAQAVVFGKRGQRHIDLTDFFLRPGETILDGDELLTRLDVPLTDGACGSIYCKLSTRNAMDLAIVGVAVFIQVEKGGRIVKARIALGAVAPTAVRVLQAEKELVGKELNLELAREVASLAVQSCDPISDIRASAEFRREMVMALCERGLLLAYRQAKGVSEERSQ